MPDLNTPYVEASPGDLITSEKWNDMQRRIRKDIGDKTQEAVDKLTRIQTSGNSDKLEGKSLSELTDELVRRAVQAIRAESGYRQLFKVLRVGEDNIVKHDLHLCPLVDLYQLDYFQVVCCEDKDTYPTWTTFYLHHEGEDRVRYARGDQRGSLSIQPERGPEYKLSFRELLSRYKVDYDDDSSLSDVENDFWQALFSDPNDRFSDDQYCHSPWFDKCCREEKTVGEARRNGDWDDLYIQVRPRKTVNFPSLADNPNGGRPIMDVTPAPTNVQVTHYDFDTLGLRLLLPPRQPAEWFPDDNTPNTPAGNLEEQIAGVRNELKLMVLLKV
ncbi:MAG TPA: hypothetical protein VNW71_01865 [Thermoanaerobaculia bacterium]|nr:hypothetical protein [Thermoanaerobaculia bacterium]